MKFESIGILIDLRPFNERDAVARIFTRDFGVLVGMLRGAVVAKKSVPLVGQVGNVSWNARLDSQLGVFHWEAEKNLSAQLMTVPQNLMYMNSAFALLVALMPERVAYNNLYECTVDLLNNLSGGGADAYLLWEISLLRELGYALNLSCCSGCGGTNSLNYISPRTGRAVCDVCAVPYVDKLYKMPINLGITLRFLDSVCAQQGVQIPFARKMLKM